MATSLHFSPLHHTQVSRILTKAPTKLTMNIINSVWERHLTHQLSILPRPVAVLPLRCGLVATPMELEAEPEAQEAHTDNNVGEINMEECWREIQGCNNWEGLLDPMNPTLRSEIIRNGEMAQACYDAFDFDPYSKYCGTCKYPATHFFDHLHMAGSGYQISRYLYTTSKINLPNFFKGSHHSSMWSQHANWMGYVAVAQEPSVVRHMGRRDIVFAWRGTVTNLEWIRDLKDILHPAGFGGDPGVKIESGFFDLYTEKESKCSYSSFSAREQVLSEIKRLVETHRGEKLSITITGHSLGAALALVSAYDLAEMGLNLVNSSKESIPITVFSFSSPRVGNLKFKERCDELGVKVLRVINVHDVIPGVPGVIANAKVESLQRFLEEKMAFPWSYSHVGVELALDHLHSPFLRPATGDLACAHNLEAHLHLVDGYQGEGQPFRLASQRDIALVNKNSNFLREEYGVPPNWWQDQHKGMVRTVEGRWSVPERPWMEAQLPDTAHHIDLELNMARPV